MNFINQKFSVKERSRFLDLWNNAYPVNSGNGYCGMLVISDDEFWLVRNGQRAYRLQISPSSIISNPGCETVSPERVLVSGDWIEIQGLLAHQSLDVESLFLLSPNRRSQGHGSKVNTLVRDWERFYRDVRAYFLEIGFDEIKTPTLVKCPGTEPFLEAFETQFVFGSRSEKYYLPTSPELHLKKCLAYGWDKIFEMRSCFRNGEISQTHQPEFYMLEWYRAFASMSDLQKDLKNLVDRMAPSGKTFQWQALSVADLFEEHLGFSLTPTTTMVELTELAKKQGVDVSSAKDFDDVFFFLFLEKIEPLLNQYECLFLHSYPPSQAALARLTYDGWGDRFEFYIKGLEIANAFNELNDPGIQRLRSQEDLVKKALNDRCAVELDEDFFQCLEGGMPPSAGIALGLDRLFMSLYDHKNITSFRQFPMR